jgi:ABC-2 type transport system ATP-binding protein
MIEAEGVGKTYGKHVALQGLTLKVEAGEVFGMLGPNGAGKSTLTKIFCGLLTPSSGKATVAGHDVTRHATAVKRLIGYLPDRVPVYKSMTARETLHLFARLQGIPRAHREERVETMLKLVNLTDVDRRPSGGFSKGMTQRLGIARALLHDPKVLFFDEPASGLDPTGRREIRALIQDLAAGGRTVFLCSHDLAEVQAVCHRIAFLRKGELVRVMAVGEAGGESREFRVDLASVAPGVADALRALPGVQRVEPDGTSILVRASDEVDRAALARAVVKAGGLHLEVREVAPSLDSLYRAYIEHGENPEASA